MARPADDSADAPPVRRIRLPDRFYLPRQLRSGTEVYDVLPWEQALDYVTDGSRFGILLRSGEVQWFRDDRVERFAEDFIGVDLDALVNGLAEYVRHNQILRAIWRDDLEALQQLRAQRPRDSSGR